MPSSTVKLLRSPDRHRHDVRVAYSLLGALGVVLGVTVGYGAGSGSSWLLAVCLALAVPVVLASIGEKWAALCLLAVAPYPLVIQHTQNIPLTWVGVAMLAFLLLSNAPRWKRARNPGPRLSRWDIVLPAAFAVSAGVSAVVAGQYQGLTSIIGPPVVIAVSVVGGCLVGAAIARNRAASLGLRAGVVSAGSIVVFLVLQAAFPSLSLPGMAGTSLVRYAGFIRIGGVIGDYELLAEYLALWGVAALWLATASHGRQRLLWAAISIASVAGIMATGTRGGAVVYFIGALVVFVRQHRWRGRLRLIAIVTAMVALGIATAAYFSVTGGLLERFALIPSPSGGVTTMINRQGLWSRYLVFDGSARDIVLGQGPGVDQYRLPAYPHNLYVYVYYTQGLLGLGLIALVLGGAIRPAAAALMKRSEWRADAVLGLLVFLFAVDQIKIEFVRLHNYQLAVWCLLGLAAAARAITRWEDSSRGNAERA